LERGHGSFSVVAVLKPPEKEKQSKNQGLGGHPKVRGRGGEGNIKPIPSNQKERQQTLRRRGKNGKGQSFNLQAKLQGG